MDRLSNSTVIGQEAVSSGHEIFVQNVETSVQLPDKDDEAAKIIIVVDKNLSVGATDSNTN